MKKKSYDVKTAAKSVCQGVATAGNVVKGVAENQIGNDNAAIEKNAVCRIVERNGFDLHKSPLLRSKTWKKFSDFGGKGIADRMLSKWTSKALLKRRKNDCRKRKGRCATNDPKK